MYIKKQILIFTILILNKFGDANVWLCQKNEDCMEMDKDATCTQSRCQCPAAKVYSFNKRMCIDSVIYGKSCDESVQCNLLSSKAVCTEGVCKCQENETYVRGKCRILTPLGGNCENTIDCYFGYDRQSVHCNDKNVCDCAPGYYKRHTTICRKKMLKVNDPCVVNSDCSELSNKAQCLKNKCTESKNNYKNINNKFDEVNKNHSLEKNLTKIANLNENTIKIGENCNELFKSCEGLANSICIGQCYCKYGYYPNNNKTLCIAEVGEIATRAEECGDSKGVKYDSSQNLCICEDNFFIDEDQKTCKKSIPFTGFCTSDGQCSPYNAICDPNSSLRKCLCAHYEEYDNELQLCVNKKGLGGPCVDNTNCNVDHSICSKDGFCVCKENYFENEDKCLRGLGADCTNKNDCVINNSTCTKYVCSCLTNFTIADNGCFKIAEKIEDYCDKIEQCQHFNAICENNHCKCDIGKHYAFEKCYQSKMLNEECSSIGECLMKSEDESSKECRNSKCKCKKGYLPHQHEQSCVYNSTTRCVSQLGMIINLIFITHFLLKKIVST